MDVTSAFMLSLDLASQPKLEGIALDAPYEVSLHPSLPDAPQTTLRLLWSLGFFGDANLNAVESWKRAQAAGWMQGLREAIAEPKDMKLPARTMVQELQDSIPEALTELQWKKLEQLLLRPTTVRQVQRRLKALHTGFFQGLLGMRLHRASVAVRHYLAYQAAINAHELVEHHQIIPAIEALASAMHWLDTTPEALPTALLQGARVFTDPHIKAACLHDTLLESELLLDEDDIALTRSQSAQVLKAVYLLKHAHRLQLLTDAIQQWLREQDGSLPPDWHLLAQRLRGMAESFPNIPLRQHSDESVTFLLRARAVAAGMARLLVDVPEGLAKQKRLLMLQMLVKTSSPVVEWGYLQALAVLRSPSLDTVEHIARVRESLGHVLLKRFARIDHGRHLSHHLPTEVKNFANFLLLHLTYHKAALHLPEKIWQSAMESFERAGADRTLVDHVIAASNTEQLTLERVDAFDYPILYRSQSITEKGGMKGGLHGGISPFDAPDLKKEHW